MNRTGTRAQQAVLGRERLRLERAPRTSRERLARWMAAEVAVDVLMLAASALSFDLVFSSTEAPSDRAVWHLVYSALFVLLLASRRLYRPRLRLQVLDDLPALALTSAAVAMALISALTLAGGDSYTSFTVRYWLFACGWLALGRTGLHVTQARARSRGGAVRRTLIVGAGKLGHVVARRLLERPELGLRPIGFLDKEPLEPDRDSIPLPVLGASWDLDRIISEHDVQHMIVTFSTAPHHVLLALARRCRERGVSVSVVPRLFELGGRRPTVEHLGGLPLVAIEPPDPRGWQFTLKYGSDRVIAALALLIASPWIAAIALAIRLTIGSPVIYRQTRVGRDGRRFEMVKFRTMKGDPRYEGEADVDWALEQIGADPDKSWTERPGLVAANGSGYRARDRRTRLGRLLRHFSLDELPQLLNVVRGEMSLVGPRPERAAYVQRFETAVYRYGDRHRVKSGITGWAQVNGLRGRTSLADRIEWDNFYVENWSPWLDLKIMLLTIWCILRGAHEEDPDFP